MAELPWKINDLLSLNSDNSQQEVFYVLNNDDDDLSLLHSKACSTFLMASTLNSAKSVSTFFKDL